MRRGYSNIAPPVPLTSNVTIGATSLPVSSTAGYPLAPFTVALERGTANEEFVLVQAVSPTSFDSCIRGYRGTTAQAHLAATSVEHAVGDIDYDEANALVNLLSAKGDLITFDGTALVRLPVGTGYLKRDDLAPGGLSYGFPTAADVGAIPLAQKGAASGVATLDGSSLLPAAQLPRDSASFIQWFGMASVTSVNIATSPAVTTISSWTVTKPSGWATFDALVFFTLSEDYVSGTGIRRTSNWLALNGVDWNEDSEIMWNDNPGGTNNFQTIPLYASIIGCATNLTVAVKGKVTAGSGNISSNNRNGVAIMLRRS